MHIHAHAHTCTCARTHMRTHAHAHRCTHACMRTHTHACTRAHMHVRANSVRMHAVVWAHVHARISRMCAANIIDILALLTGITAYLCYYHPNIFFGSGAKPHPFFNGPLHPPPHPLQKKWSTNPSLMTLSIEPPSKSQLFFCIKNSRSFPTKLCEAWASIRQRPLSLVRSS